MWYRYNNTLYNLESVYMVSVEDSSIKLYPYRLIFYNKDMNPMYNISFETKFDATQQLDIVEKLLNK